MTRKMKKYCLTDCAKAKLSKGKENILAALTVIFILAVVITIMLVVFYILGNLHMYLIAHGIVPAPTEPFKSVMEAGVIAFGFLCLFGVVVLIVSVIFRNLYKFTYQRIRDRVTGERKSCQLFEECRGGQKN